MVSRGYQHSAFTKVTRRVTVVQSDILSLPLSLFLSFPLYLYFYFYPCLVYRFIRELISAIGDARDGRQQTVRP